MCKCGNPSRPKHKYCLACHNSYMRQWRKTHRLNGEARLKMNCRSYANEYQRRGVLKIQPCEVSGCSSKAQKHHDDYSKPLQIRWLCRIHHLELHNSARETLIKG